VRAPARSSRRDLEGRSWIEWRSRPSQAAARLSQAASLAPPPTLQVDLRSSHLLGRTGLAAGEGSDAAAHSMMSPLDFMLRLALPASHGHDGAARGCFAAVNPSNRKPGLSRTP
jgi:hypothetical protein